MVLALIQPRITEIPHPGGLARLASNRKLLRLAVVDQVVSCPSYALVVTGSMGGKVGVSFEAQGPVLDGSVQPETGRGGKWIISTTSGFERCASFTEAKCYGRFPFLFFRSFLSVLCCVCHSRWGHTLTVLFRLKYITRSGIKDHRRGSDGPYHIPDDAHLTARDIGDDVELPLYDVPWGELDEDGDDEYVDELDEFTLAEIATFKH